MSDISKARVKGVVYDIKDERARNLVEQHELAIQEILENYARMDGYYETMGVGVATNLKGSNTSVAKFVYRKSGGSESVDSGLAQLTSMRGKSVVSNEKILNFNAESLKTIGFNQYNPSTSKAHVLQGVVYHIQGPYTSLSLNGATITPDSSGLFTPASTGYLTVSGGGSNTCINISDPSKNGTYEPYWESNLPLNINTQTGKLNGSGDSIVVFPNGMAGMNGVQDTIQGNTAVKKFYQVNDLTTLPITLNYEGYAPEEEGGDTVYSFILELPKNGKAFTSAVMNGLFNKKYSASYGISAASSNNFYIYTLQGKSYVEIMDDDFATDARFADEEEWDALIADIRTSLANKVLMYELSVQEEYILDGIELPLNYKVDKDGTEQIIPNTSDPDNNIPSTTPCDMDIVYSIDAANTIINLPNNYVSATQQQSFSAAQQAQAKANIGLSSVATKYKTTIQGDGNNEYTITHNLSSTSVFVVVQDASTLEQISGYQVIADSANQIRIVFSEEIGVGVTYNILILS